MSGHFSECLSNGGGFLCFFVLVLFSDFSFSFTITLSHEPEGEPGCFFFEIVVLEVLEVLEVLALADMEVSFVVS